MGQHQALHAHLLMRVNGVRMAASITENLALITSRVTDTYQAAGSARAVNPPRLVAVSKTKPKEAVIEAYKAGQRVFGDYEEAIRMGSTNVRVGSSIFGARSYPAASASASAAASKGVENSGGVVGGRSPTIEANTSANTQNIAA